MSRAALALPIRTLTSAAKPYPAWICRRCLATQTGTLEVPNYDPTLPARKRIGQDGQRYRLKKSDFFLKKKLPQERIPIAYLQHSTSTILHSSEKAQREAVLKPKKRVGVVVSSGLMEKTVKVRVAGQKWNSRIGKMFKDHTNYLVHDPNNSLVTGDVIEMHRLRVSRKVGHVVGSIVAPFGQPLESRPPVPTPDERLAAYKEKRFAKLDRRALRKQAADGEAAAIEQLRDLGVGPGAGTEAAEGKPEETTRRQSSVLRQKGRKLPSGVLHDGLHDVGKISDRARHNKEKATKMETRTGDNMLDVKETTDAPRQGQELNTPLPSKV